MVKFWSVAKFLILQVLVSLPQRSEQGPLTCLEEWKAELKSNIATIGREWGNEFDHYINAFLQNLLQQLNDSSTKGEGWTSDELEETGKSDSNFLELPTKELNKVISLLNNLFDALFGTPNRDDQQSDQSSMEDLLDDEDISELISPLLRDLGGSLFDFQTTPNRDDQQSDQSSIEYLLDEDDISELISPLVRDLESSLFDFQTTPNSDDQQSDQSSMEDLLDDEDISELISPLVRDSLIDFQTLF
ncbi:uncharacterized protein LOC129248062 [Anastrepha obliqua]|uniref:uncharacterized protein LOC129248062 n=1 Tax=Anastrepha obliqua TaxID=95512 RepID=UPI002409A739|nr:uncharacterized protein LOC129248062 [Anastrepha obliqua]